MGGGRGAVDHLLRDDFEASLPAVPDQKTLVLINTFIVQTTGMINRFSALCERKLESVDRSIKRVDIQLQLLESKLSSVDGLDVRPAPHPAPAAPPPAGGAPAIAASDVATSSNGPPAHPSGPAQDNGAPPLPPPPPPLELGTTPAEAQPPVEEVADYVKVKDHEDFAKFFRMERMGVPAQAVKNRMALEGIDPEILNDPNAPAPY
mmetsp:Transcript_19781/g.37740  ORF Transcript_19781/g.37740 Transcript_19781/m.37740 type:complete len:206 (+) Transcript_19781:276-893(+)